MPCPNLPKGFDPLDADLNLKGLPVAELAELRKSEPIHWVDVPGGTGGFGDKGYWIVTKHKDVKEVSRRSDVFGSSPDGAIPVWPQSMTRDAIDLQRNVLLNMDAPQHTRLRKIISRGFTPRAIGRLEDELAARAQKIAETAAAQETGDFVEQVACELPLQAIAELLGVPQDDRDKLFRWSNEMTAGEDPEYADIDPAMSSVELIQYAMKMAEERAKNPTEDIVTKLIEADIDGEKLSDDEFGFFVVMLAVAGNETTRNSTTHGMIAFAENPDQWELFKRERPETAVDEIVRWATPVSAFQRTALEDTELSGVKIKKGELPLGQLRRRGLRGPLQVQHPARPEPARRLRRHRGALLHRRQPRQADPQADLQRDRRPHARSEADRRTRASEVRLAQRHQALAGGLHRQVPGGALSR
jgi:cholest-4-en-3-one 26-monooxygenase